MNEPQPLTRYIGMDSMETPRLIIRPFELTDAEAMYRNWAGDPEVTRFMTWEPYENAEGTLERISLWIEGYAKQEEINWAIVLKEIDEPIGSIGMLTDKLADAFDFGYCIGKKWWHKGIVAEAAKAVVDLAFQNGAYRMQAYHHPDNPNSGHVMQKVGLQLEGKLRGAAYTKVQGRYDRVVYAMLREDWEKFRSDAGAVRDIRM
ncbi:GNAT family acetyltransferase [Clostridia bacterium]|nr:GNAT family acetyltransferase [Clostridia bacterium]